MHYSHEGIYALSKLPTKVKQLQPIEIIDELRNQLPDVLRDFFNVINPDNLPTEGQLRGWARSIFDKYPDFNIGEVYMAFHAAQSGFFDCELKIFGMLDWPKLDEVIAGYLKHRQKVLPEIVAKKEATERYLKLEAEYKKLVELDNELTRKNIQAIYKYVAGEVPDIYNTTRYLETAYLQIAPSVVTELKPATIIHTLIELLEFFESKGKYQKSKEYYECLELAKSRLRYEATEELVAGGESLNTIKNLIDLKEGNINFQAEAEVAEMELVYLVSLFHKKGVSVEEFISRAFADGYPVCPIAKAKFENSQEYKIYKQLNN